MIDVKARIFAIIGQTFGCDPAIITNETQAEDIDGWDSLSHTVLIVSIERQFGIQLDMAEVLDVEDVGGLVGVVERAVSAKPTVGT